jgi:hypothetical protein
MTKKREYELTKEEKYVIKNKRNKKKKKGIHM